MDDLQKRISETEDWLREHPDAYWEARHDKIVELADLKTQLENFNNTDNGN